MLLSMPSQEMIDETTASLKAAQQSRPGLNMAQQRSRYSKQQRGGEKDIHNMFNQ